MAMRSRVSASKDKQIFKRTASRSKKINLRPVLMRGGYRM